MRVEVEEDGRSYNGVANVGKRPTFDKRDILLEAHLFDFEGDLYSKHLRVQLVAFLREEQSLMA